MLVDFPFPPHECAYILYQDVQFKHGPEVFEKKAFPHLLEFEGIDYDSGGVSKFGITAPTLAKYRYRHYPRNRRHARVTPDDVEALTKSEARAVYKTLFWEGLRINEIRSEAIAIAVLNQTVHRGEVGGIIFLQNSINKFAPETPVSVTGIMTDETLNVLNKFDEKQFIKFFAHTVDRNYKAIVANNPRQRRNLPGWRNRAVGIAALADEDME